MTDQFLNIGLIQPNEELLAWLIKETENHNIQIHSLSVDTPIPQHSVIHAIYCISVQHDPEFVAQLYAKANEAIQKSADVLWLVGNPIDVNDPITESAASEARDIAESLKGRGQYVLDYFDQVTAENVLEFIHEYHKIWSSKPPKNHSTISLLPTLTRTASALSAAADQPFDPFCNVIAVSGHRGSGATFVAWNLAALLQAPVMAKNNSTLGAWLHLQNQSGHPTGLQSFSEVKGVRAATFEDIDLNEDQLKNLCMANKLVIDVGEDRGELWQKAHHRVFVTAPDPQFAKHPFPNEPGILRILNRFPEGAGLDPTEVFQKDIHLTIPILQGELINCLWGQKAWILTQPGSVQEHWKSLLRTKEESQPWQPPATAATPKTSW